MGQASQVADAKGRAQALLARLAESPPSEESHAALALELAQHLFVLAEGSSSAEDRARQARIARLLGDPAGQLFSVLLTDRVAHDESRRHASGQLAYLSGRLGLPGYMSASERLLLELGRSLGAWAPRLVGSLMLRKIRSEVEGLLFSLGPAALERYLKQRRAEGIEVNLNHLGEEVLGEAEAERRTEEYVGLLARPEVQTVSIKLSAIFSQIDVWAWEASLGSLSERLRRIYRAALSHPLGSNGSARSKLVYLDMEAYRDLHLAFELVTRVLDEPEFLALRAGLVLQAYVPDSAPLQRRLLGWAESRRGAGGAPVRLRIVKGANLASERVRASLMGWPLPTYASKAEVDANYKRLLYAGTEPHAAAAVHLGVASHNLFDLALGLVLRAARRVEDCVGFELLEGMANGTRRALRSLGAPVLVYAPAVEDHSLGSAVAYLIRRLDENTAPENYLSHAFSMRPGDARWQAQAARFRQAHEARSEPSEAPRGDVDRFARLLHPAATAPFENEPDTDLAVAGNRARVQAALAELEALAPWSFGSVIASDAERVGEETEAGFDPSRPGLVPYHYLLAPRPLLEAAVQAAVRAREGLDEVTLERRLNWVLGVARQLRERRAELIAAMVLDTGKRVNEADAEVSEAVDFAEYYVRCAAEHARVEGLERRPKGVVVVASPWNFPLAIPLSGILAALLGGNSVLFKPSLESPFVGEQLASLVWQAGVPQGALQFLLCRDEDASLLIEHPKVNTVVLTGATSTARFFLERRPGLDLCAETGGKNALIVSAIADRELAIRDLVASAFGHAGQKCSAASLAIVHKDTYDDPRFMRQLRDAAASLRVGSAWDPTSVVTPLIRPPEGPLARALTKLDHGESWLLEPRIDPQNPRLCSPGIKLGVKAGSFTHQTELFGPVLGVMRGKDLEDCLRLANGTPYGLVLGLHSLDEREQERFLHEAASGNLYINRKITGAIVGRQPFGGHKASNVGPGAKAGGRNYVLQFQHLNEPVPLPAAILSRAADEAQRPEGALARAASKAAFPVSAALLRWAEAMLSASELAVLRLSLDSYERALLEHFRVQHDEFALVGEDNSFRYLRCGRLAVFAAERARVVDVLRASAAAAISGVELELVLSPELASQLADVAGLAQALSAEVRCESSDLLADALAGRQYERIRWLADVTARPSEKLLRAAAASGCYVASQRVLWHGRYELLYYHREQAISVDYHRYGHLGWRSLSAEPRVPRESREPSTNSKAMFSPSGPAARGP